MVDYRKPGERPGCPPWAAEWRGHVRHHLAEMIRVTESPAEALLAVALSIEDDGTGGFFFRPGDVSAQHEPNGAARARRIDFAVMVPGRPIAVEVDGHEHHDLTPLLAAATKARARELTALGWEVMPFGAVEISRDPRRCAREIRRRVEQASNAGSPVAADAPDDEPLRLSPSLAAMAERTPAEREAAALLAVVLEAPALVHLPAIRDAMLAIDGPVSLAAVALLASVSRRGDLDRHAFLAACPAMLQPTACEALSPAACPDPATARDRALAIVDRLNAGGA